MLISIPIFNFFKVRVIANPVCRDIPFYYGGLMALAQQRGLPTIAWAQGVGPLRSGFSRWLTRKTLIGCEKISVRDRASAELLSNWGVSPLLAPDPVWALESEPFPQLWQLPAPRLELLGVRLESAIESSIRCQLPLHSL